MVGRSLLHYEIVERLGSGGMGAVYRARDTRLHRDVAVKVLPQEVALDEDWRNRFEREAWALAAVDHPNIVTVYSIEEGHGENGTPVHFITMQLVDGVPLSELIPAGGLPLDTFLRIAVPLADAVAAAHECGVIHRDLKPANVMVAGGSRVKVLDFGLAELREWARRRLPSGGPLRGDAESVTEELVEFGGIVGTVDYMAPEQIQGRAADPRSDIFSLGIVMYEMATGRRPFRDGSRRAVLSSILRDDPEPLTRAREDLPARLDEIVGRALAKQPGQRFQSARDLEEELEELRARPGAASPPAEAVGAAGATARWPWVVVAAGIAALALLAVRLGWLPASVPDGVTSVPLTSLVGSERDPALSPDGEQVAFAWDGAGKGNFELHVQTVATGELRRLTRGATDARVPRWSPDGTELAYLRRDGTGWQVVILAADGEERIPGSIASVGFVGLDWSPAGRHLAVVDRLEPGGDEGIFLLDLESGDRRRLTGAGFGGVGDRDPRFSPDGRRLAFVRWYEEPRTELYVVPVVGGEPDLIDTQQGFIRGVAWTRDGSGLIFSSHTAGAQALWRVSLEGGSRRLPTGEGAWELTIGGGGRLVYSRSFGDANIWRVPGPLGAAAKPTRLVASTRDDWSPRYSPDGRWLALASDRGGEPGIWICAADGTGCRPAPVEGLANVPRWSPDGELLAYGTRDSTSCVIRVDGGVPPRCWPAERTTELTTGWSADGRWMYFASDRTGDYQVWKRPLDDGDPVRLTSQGGMLPQESTDGRLVYYLRDTRPFSIWRASVAGGGEAVVFKHPGLTVSGFDVWRGQLVFFLLDEDRGPVIHRLDPDTGELTEVVALGAQVRLGKYGRLSVSPDGRWIAYPQEDGSGGDLILVEGVG